MLLSRFKCFVNNDMFILFIMCCSDVLTTSDLSVIIIIVKRWTGTSGEFRFLKWSGVGSSVKRRWTGHVFNAERKWCGIRVRIGWTC